LEDRAGHRAEGQAGARAMSGRSIGRVTLAIVVLGAVAGRARAQGPRAAILPRIDSVVSSEMGRGLVPGVAIAVVDHGQLVIAKGYGLANVEHSVPMSIETVFRIGSITKQFTATGIMELVEQGKISLDDEITKFLPDYPTQGHKVTIRHLLTHTSG